MYILVHLVLTEWSSLLLCKIGTSNIMLNKNSEQNCIKKSKFMSFLSLDTSICYTADWYIYTFSYLIFIKHNVHLKTSLKQYNQCNIFTDQIKNIFSPKIYIYIDLKTLILTHFTRSKNKTLITQGGKITLNNFDQTKLLGESHETCQDHVRVIFHPKIKNA